MGYQEEYNQQAWQNQYRTGTPNEFDHDRRPSPFYNQPPPAPPVRNHITQHTTEYPLAQTAFSREPMRQQVFPQHARGGPIPAPAAPVVHHPVLMRDQYYRPQYSPTQFSHEYTNGFQPPFAAAAPFGVHPGMQHMPPNARRHEDSLRNLRSPLLEDFRSAKNKHHELKVYYARFRLM